MREFIPRDRKLPWRLTPRISVAVAGATFRVRRPGRLSTEPVRLRGAAHLCVGHAVSWPEQRRKHEGASRTRDVSARCAPGGLRPLQLRLGHPRVAPRDHETQLRRSPSQASQVRSIRGRCGGHACVECVLNSSAFAVGAGPLLETRGVEARVRGMACSYPLTEGFFLGCESAMAPCHRRFARSQCASSRRNADPHLSGGGAAAEPLPGAAGLAAASRAVHARLCSPTSSSAFRSSRYPLRCVGRRSPARRRAWPSVA